MFFIVKNNKYLQPRQLKASALMKAYYVVSNFPLAASDQILDAHLQAKYNTGLKNLCVKLLLNIKFLKNDEGDFVLIFQDPAMDKLAQLITYGNGAVPGSKILQMALKD